MLTKADHINYWKQTAADSWESADYLFGGKKFPEALFMYCLAIEKWLKAKWVIDNASSYPPRIHDLHSIYGETDLQLDAANLILWTRSTVGTSKDGIPIINSPYVKSPRRNT